MFILFILKLLMAFVEERACFLHLGLGGAPFRFEFRIIRVLGDYGAER